ncbi:MAG TPA: S8 family serine peptidase [Polyangiaceae bacterium]|nr:S8 family serine peptidase [Polyangiaceae bacterium]
MAGAIPFAGFYHLTFTDTANGTALSAKSSAFAADPAVATVTRDLVLAQSTLAPMRPHDTDIEMLDPSTTYKEFFGLTADMPLGADGKWAFQKTGVFDAWDAIYAQNSPMTRVVIGVIDGRIVQNVVFPGLAFAGGHDLRIWQTEPADSPTVKHGTAVAAIIGAPNDGKGMNGILSGLKCIDYDIAPMAVTETGMAPILSTIPEGQLGVNAIFYGLAYSVLAGARVVNLSMGAAQAEAVRYSLTRVFRLIAQKAPDTLFVIAAGNNDVDAATFFPASSARTDEDTQAPNVMSIAAVDESDAQAVWFNPAMPTMKLGASNHDDRHNGSVTLAAPGVKELSELPDGSLTMFSGTSGAAPMVSGAAGCCSRSFRLSRERWRRRSWSIIHSRSPMPVCRGGGST